MGRRKTNRKRFGGANSKVYEILFENFNIIQGEMIRCSQSKITTKTLNDAVLTFMSTLNEANRQFSPTITQTQTSFWGIKSRTLPNPEFLTDNELYAIKENLVSIAPQSVLRILKLKCDVASECENDELDCFDASINTIINKFFKDSIQKLLQMQNARMEILKAINERKPQGVFFDYGGSKSTRRRRVKH